MMGSDIATKHISNMTICDKLPSKVEKNQSWLIRGTYDYGAYPGNFEVRISAPIVCPMARELKMLTRL